MNSCDSAEPHVASNVRYITFSMSLYFAVTVAAVPVVLTTGAM